MNKVELIGKVLEVKKSHEYEGHIFYNVEVEVKRRSEVSDFIDVIVSSNRINKIIDKDMTIQIAGKIRTKNIEVSTNKTKLAVYVYAYEINEVDESTEHINNVDLEGFLCRAPLNRTTPRNKHITELLIAVNRRCGQSSYIPTISWGIKNAMYSKTLDVGNKLSINGRLQTRHYDKEVDGIVRTFKVHELSAKNINLATEVEEPTKETV